MNNMFNNKNLKSPYVDILSAGTVVYGDMALTNDFRIDGTLKGNIICRGKLTVGSSGNIEGTIECENAEISGTITGSIKASVLIVLKESSNFNGTISTVQLSVDAGAKLNITCTTKDQLD